MDEAHYLCGTLHNSAAYMDHCGDPSGRRDDIEIILVDDDSTKGRYPTSATGMPSSIQDCQGHPPAQRRPRRGREPGTCTTHLDSTLQSGGLGRLAGYRRTEKVLDKLRELPGSPTRWTSWCATMAVRHVGGNSAEGLRYTNVSGNKVFTWTGHCASPRYLLMHSVIYAPSCWRSCGLELPKHTFYGQYLLSISPALCPERFTWILDLYRYFIGRSDQSVNERVMVIRVDQWLRVTTLMIDAHDLKRYSPTLPELGPVYVQLPRP